MKRFFLLCFFSAFQLLAFSQANNPALKKVIDRLIKFEMNRDLDKIPGYVVGAMEGDSSYFYGYGTKEIGQEQLPDQHTIFEAGSISKLITACIIYRMEAAGELSLEDTLGMYLDDFPSIHHLSILSLLNHSAGLPRLPYNFGASAKKGENPFESYSLAHLNIFLSDFRLKTQEVGKYNYSHLGYGLLQNLLEKKTKEPFEEIAQKWIFSPLGMQNSFFGQKRPDSIDQVQGYSMLEKPVQFWNTSFFSGSVGLKTNAADLIKFVGVFQGETDLGETLRKTLLPTVKKDKFMEIGAGWHLIMKPDFYDIRGHSGATDGCSAYIGYIPETETAVVVLTNSEIKASKLGSLTLQLMNFNWNKRKMKKVMKERSSRTSRK